MDFIRGQNTPYFLETLISIYDFGPVKLPGLSRNGPLKGNMLPVVVNCLLQPAGHGNKKREDDVKQPALRRKRLRYHRQIIHSILRSLIMRR